MKKILLLFFIAVVITGFNTINAQTEPNAAEKAMEATKEATDKTIEATKKATKKTVKVTKEVTKKTVEATKEGYKKTVDTTKDVTDKTIEGAKDVIDNLNPNKPVTLQELETSASINTLKNQKKEVKAAYNSRIKDINAQIKAAEKSTSITDVQRQNKIYNLNKEKAALIEKRDSEVKSYNDKIKSLKEKRA